MEQAAITLKLLISNTILSKATKILKKYFKMSSSC